MHATNVTNRLHFGSIDDYLGPAETRFFGSGYRRVRYHVREVTPGGGIGEPQPLRAEVAVTYPADWSRKSDDSVLRPHLSTVDSLILSAQLSEVYLNDLYAMDARQRQTAWLRRVDIKAGSTPYEDGLDALQVEVSLRGTTPVPGAAGSELSVLDCRVGNMRVGCEIAHEIHSPGTPGWQRRSIANLGRSASARLLGTGYQNQRQIIEDLIIDPGSQRADAQVTLCPAPEGIRPSHAYRPSVSMVDSFVVSLQLGQVLLYELDRIERTASNTLWMRHTTITAETPSRPTNGPFAASVSLLDSRLIQARGATWRTATILGECQGVRTRCAVTHELPAR